MYCDIGRMTNAVEVRQTQSGMVVGNFTIAVDRAPTKDGKRESDFIDCTAFGKRAEFIAKYFPKGTRIYVEGELRSDLYTDKTGVKRKKVFVLVNNTKFCEGKGSTAQTESAGAEIPDIPQAPIPQYAPPQGSFEDVDDGSDLPF